MYTAIVVILFTMVGLCLYAGIRNKRSSLIGAGITIAVLSLAFFWFMDFWGEKLWFDALGYGSRYLTEIGYKIVLTSIGALFGVLFVGLLTFPIPRNRTLVHIGSKMVAAIIGGQWAMINWDVILKYLNAVHTVMPDPILGKDTGFYMFTLPFYDDLYSLLLILSIISLATAFIATYVRIHDDEIGFRYSETESYGESSAAPSLYVSAAGLFFVLALGKYLDRFHIMYSTWGVVAGAGWTDVHIRLPAYMVVMVITFLLGVAMFIPQFRKSIAHAISRARLPREISHAVLIGGALAIMFASWLLALTIIPGMLQWLRVEPNEITFERPYIANNIELTRYGFGLNVVEENEFPSSDQLTPGVLENNRNIIDNVRLWDWRALDAVYQQFQEIRLYYEFEDVDIDRYMIDGEYRQVMVSAREMEQQNLPDQSQTFVNKRFKYTHGYGLTLTTVNEFTPDGLPNLLIKDIPPVSSHQSLDVSRPEIYYGILTRSHVIVNSKEPEFDYPSGDENRYINYQGAGGVSISNMWRKFIYGWKFDGTRLFLSGYPTQESRIMFHRQIEERISRVAPFLVFDDDPYITLDNGRLYWIIDAYTTSTYFPYSEPYNANETIEYIEGDNSRWMHSQVAASLRGVNYIRNSVKIVVDAYNGNVDMYLFDPDDPVIQVWDRIFPGIFKSRNEMPEGLLRHIRYPSDLLLVQGLVYAKYHMTDPTVFYNQEDLWIRATEKYYNRVQPVEPYYIMWEQPGSDKQEFVLMLPFTPKNRQVLIGWIAGMCDPDNYGRFLAYQFPKEKRILGTQQVETKIDQDRFLAGQLTLWDQRGSSVIRGNVLVLPIDDTLIYVEPIYLQSETAAYPELRLVAVMYDDNLSYAETFEEALHGLFEGISTTPITDVSEVTSNESMEQLIVRANAAFNEYLELSGEKQFQDAARALERLQESLDLLSRQRQSNETDEISIP